MLPIYKYIYVYHKDYILIKPSLKFIKNSEIYKTKVIDGIHDYHENIWVDIVE